MLVGLFSHFVDTGQNSFKGKIIEGYNFSFSHTHTNEKLKLQRHTVHFFLEIYFSNQSQNSDHEDFSSSLTKEVFHDEAETEPESILWFWVERNLWGHASSGAEHLLLLREWGEGCCQSCSQPQILVLWRPWRTHSELSVHTLWLLPQLTS